MLIITIAIVIIILLLLSLSLLLLLSPLVLLPHSSNLHAGYVKSDMSHDLMSKATFYESKELELFNKNRT